LVIHEKEKGGFWCLQRDQNTALSSGRQSRGEVIARKGKRDRFHKNPLWGGGREVQDEEGFDCSFVA